MCEEANKKAVDDIRHRRSPFHLASLIRKVCIFVVYPFVYLLIIVGAMEVEKVKDQDMVGEQTIID